MTSEEIKCPLKPWPAMLLAVVSLLVPTAAFAAPGSGEPGWYVGAGMGRTSNSTSDMELAPDTTKSTRAVGYRLRTGYQFNQYLMAELAYTDLGRYKTDSPDLYLRVKAHALMLNAIGVVPLSSGFSLLAKLGIANLYYDASLGTRSGSWRTDQRAIRPTLMAGAGMRYLISPKLALRAEYDFMQATTLFKNGGKLGHRMMSLSVDYLF